MPTYCNHLLLGTLTTETPAVAPTTLYPRLSTTPFPKRNSAATSPPPPPPRSSLSSSTPLCLPALKSWNSLSQLNPSTVQTTTFSPLSQGDNSKSKMPFVSLSWANASFLNVEVVDSIDADPFLEKRHDDHHSTTAAAALLDTESVQKMRPERIGEDEEDDEMLSDCEESDTDTDQGLTDDGYGDFESVDIHNDGVEHKYGGCLSDTAGVGAGAGGALKTGTIGVAYQDHKVFGEERNGISGDEEEERLRIEKLTQGILALQLETSNNNNNNNNTHSHRVHIAKIESTTSPNNLEYGYRGPPPSPSWLSLPRSETESVSSSSSTAASSSSTTSTLLTTQNNGVTVRGTYVIIKMPKNRESVVTMPEGFSSVAVVLPSTTVEVSDDVEEKEFGMKRSSESLKTVEGTGVSPKKRR
ncbi:hypothetical protein BGZ96_000150 [Linnemannia gamsii]|uniref:Uncharacterized protein n=1 Tax=Linnemannia gamsii TaxID=64522 RepID=A0ABQ7JQ18_9FUNG|nr:hypothetical protein BGZ96_000150 [Linnemannia gamsii]